MFHFQMLVFDCKLIRPVLCSFPTGFLIDTQLYLCGAKTAMRTQKASAPSYLSGHNSLDEVNSEPLILPAMPASDRWRLLSAPAAPRRPAPAPAPRWQP